MTGMFRGDDPAGALRAGLLLLVVLGVGGTAVSLAYERHWTTGWQWAPWITLGVITVAAAALIVRPTGVTVRIARAAAVLAIVGSVLGVWQHVDANLDPAHDHGDHADTATASADDAQDEEAASEGHHGDDDETAASSGDHHGNDDETTASGHHGNDDETPASGHHGNDDESAPPSDRPAAEEVAESSEASMADVLTGSAGTVPVPAALAIAPVGLALALATIGLGGRRPT